MPIIYPQLDGVKINPDRSLPLALIQAIRKAYDYLAETQGDVIDIATNPSNPTDPSTPDAPESGGEVTGFTFAQEVRTRYAGDLDRMVHLTVGFTPIVEVPRTVTYLISKDAKTTWTWVGSQKLKKVDQILYVDQLAIEDDANWAVACIAGNQGGDPVPIPHDYMLALYPGIAISNLFPVLGLHKPTTNQGIKATIGTCTNVITSDGLTQYGSIPGVVYYDPTSGTDFGICITVQDLDSAKNPLSAENLYANNKITGGKHTTGELLVTYTPGLAFIRYRFYAGRIDDGGDFANTNNNTLQQVFFNGNSIAAGYYDVPITIPIFIPIDPNDTFNVLNIAAREVGPRYQDEKAQLHTVVGLTPILDVGFDHPHTVTFWLDFGDGKPVWQDSWQISYAGQEVRIGDQTLGSDGTRKSGKIWAPLNTANGNWKAYCAPGRLDQNASPFDYPMGPFHVGPAIACSPNGTTDVRFVADPATSDPITYFKDALGNWYWEYYRLEWTPPTQDADPNYWKTLITIQKGATISGVWTPAPDAEGANADPFLNFLGRVHEEVTTTAGLAHDQTVFMQRKGAWPATWIIPPEHNANGTPNLYREFRFLCYSVSRLGTDSSGSGGAGTYTLQNQCWPGGADHFILIPVPKKGDLDLTYTNPLTITGPLSGGAGMPITIAPGDITGAYLPDDAIQARHMAEDSITAANKALAINSIVDGNIKDVNVVKLIYGINVFTGDVVLSRGSGLPVIVLANTGLNLFGQANPTDGRDGLLTKPNVSITSSAIGLFSGEVSGGVVGAASTITANAITFWSKNALTTAPYVTVSANGIVMSDGSAAPGPNTFTLNSSGFDLFESGGTHITAQGGVFQIIKPRPVPATDGSNLFKVDAGGLVFSTGIIGNANYTVLTMDPSGMKVNKGAAGETNVAITTNAITMKATATGPSVAMTASSITLMSGTSSGPVATINPTDITMTQSGANGPTVKLSATGLELINGGASGYNVKVTGTDITLSNTVTNGPTVTISATNGLVLTNGGASGASVKITSTSVTITKGDFSTTNTDYLVDIDNTNGLKVTSTSPTNPSFFQVHAVSIFAGGGVVAAIADTTGSYGVNFRCVVNTSPAIKYGQLEMLGNGGSDPGFGIAVGCTLRIFAGLGAAPANATTPTYWIAAQVDGHNVRIPAYQ